MSNQTLMAPDDVVRDRGSLIGRIIAVQAKAFIQRFEVRLVPRDMPPVLRDDTRPSQFDNAVLVKMPGLASFFSGCGHMKRGGPVGEIDWVTIVGKVVPSERTSFNVMLTDVTEITIHPNPPLSFLPSEIPVDVSSIGASQPFEAAFESDPNLTEDERAHLRTVVAERNAAW